MACNPAALAEGGRSWCAAAHSLTLGGAGGALLPSCVRITQEFTRFETAAAPDCTTALAAAAPDCMAALAAAAPDFTAALAASALVCSSEASDRSPIAASKVDEVAGSRAVGAAVGAPRPTITATTGAAVGASVAVGDSGGTLGDGTFGVLAAQAAA
eukprot:6341258-Prymnesium_polylepis.1